MLSQLRSADIPADPIPRQGVTVPEASTIAHTSGHALEKPCARRPPESNGVARLRVSPVAPEDTPNVRRKNAPPEIRLRWRLRRERGEDERGRGMREHDGRTG